MSDRVFFATQNNTGTPENSSGFGRFPFRLTATISGVSFPDFLFWVVREWGTSDDLVTTLVRTPTREREICLLTEARWTDGTGTYLLLEYAEDFTSMASFYNSTHPEYGVLYANNYDDSFTFGDDTKTGLVSVGPTLWWPYSNSAGLPIYDGSGGQIRDPLS